MIWIKSLLMSTLATIVIFYSLFHFQGLICFKSEKGIALCSPSLGRLNYRVINIH